MKFYILMMIVLIISAEQLRGSVLGGNNKEIEGGELKKCSCGGKVSQARQPRNTKMHQKPYMTWLIRNDEQQQNNMDQINQFLSKDTISLKDPTFSTTQYIAQLIVKKQNIQESYQKFTKLEDECEQIIGNVIDTRYQYFIPLIQKPSIYGKNYDRLSQSVRQNRRRLNKAKELLSTRSVDLRQIHYQSIYCKQILNVLNKLRSIRESIRGMECSYQGCLEYRQVRMLINSLPQQSAQVSYLNQILNDKTKQIMDAFQDELKLFFFGSKEQIFYEQDAQKYHNAINKFNKELLPEIELINYKALSLCLIDEENDAFKYQFQQLKRFIKTSFTFQDFEQVKVYIEQNTNRTGDLVVNHKMNGNLLSLFMCVKGAVFLKQSNTLLNKHFEQFKYNMQDLFTKILIQFVKEQQKNTQISNGLFGELEFKNSQQFKNVSDFFKKLVAYVVILIRKQVLFGKMLHFLNVDVDENTLLLTLSELCRQLFWQLNVMLSLFYRKTDQKTKDILDVRNEFHLFISSGLNQYIPPSPLYYLLQRRVLEEALTESIEALKQFMRVEPIFKEPIDNEINLQKELNKSIYDDCVKQVFEGVKSLVRKGISSNKFFMPLIDYQLKMECSDQLLNEKIKQDEIDQYYKLKMQIPECLQITSITLQLTIINEMTELKEEFPQIITWILNVFEQECRLKLKSCVSGAISEQLLYNQEKLGLQKQLLAYMEWKTKYQQSNELLNDGINTESRLLKAQKDKQFRQQFKANLHQGYKDFLIGNTRYTDPELIRSKENLHSICTLHDHINVFLEISKQCITKYLDKIDQSFLIKELGIQQKDIDKNNIIMLKNFQLRCEQQGVQLENSKKNALETVFNDNYKQCIYRMLRLMNDIFKIQQNCFFILRFEFHLRCLLITNISDFYFDYCNFQQAIKESSTDQIYKILFIDFWTVFKMSIKANFIRQRDFNPKNIQVILKDLNVLKEDFKDQFKKIAHLRRYFKLYLVQKQDVEKFLKMNPFKYKFQAVEEYCSLTGLSNEGLKKYCL